MKNFFLKIKADKLFLVTIIIFVFAFFIFRPYFMQERGLLYVGDDESYFAYATSLAFFQFPDYSKEYFSVGGRYPMHSIGPGIMAFPFVFSFSLIDRMQHSPIIEKRDITNIIDSWTLFGFIISTIFYFYFGVVLIYKALNYYYNERISFYVILFMILFQFFPLYVFRRPILSHIYEFFLQAVLIYILVKDSKTKFLDNIKWWGSVLLGIIIGLITLVRYNNLFFSLLWPIIIFCLRDKSFNFKKHFKKLVIIYSTAFVLIFLFKLLLNIIYDYEAYITGGLAGIFRFEGIVFYLKYLVNIFVGLDWGLIFTAPFLVFSIFYSFIAKYKLKKQILIILIPVIVNFYAYFRGLGGWYGYRIIFFSIAPILIVPFADFLEKSMKKINHKLLLAGLSVISIYPILSMLSYEGIIKMTECYYSPIVRNYYHIDIWKVIFSNPKDYITSIIKGGPLFIIYLFSKVFGFFKVLPQIVQEKYIIFGLDVLIKTILLYITPFIMYFFVRIFKFEKKKNYHK
jgi:hypothetical protein